VIAARLNRTYWSENEVLVIINPGLHNSVDIATEQANSKAIKKSQLP